MMHVMQPVVLDTGWSTTHSSASSSSVPADVTVAVTASLSSAVMNGLTNTVNTGSHFQPQNISTSQATSLAQLSASTPLTSMNTPTNPVKPPKKPLTPYMRFSKAMWPEVKQANPDRSVCEIGSVIGRMWRELSDIDKQPYYHSFTTDKAEYDEILKAYLDANRLKPSDLVKPKVRKKDTKKQIQQPQLTAVNQPWPVSSASAAASSTPSRPADGQCDDLLVYHVRADGTQECYVQRAADGGIKPAAAAGEREMLLTTLAEQTRNVTQLQLQLLNARNRVAELEQQNSLLRQLLRDAQLPTR